VRHISILKCGYRAKHDRTLIQLHYHQVTMQLQPTDALLVIDVQNDFMPGRALGVADGDAIVPLINTLARKFDHVILTQDWHPAHHISFATTHTKQPYEVIEAPYGPQTLWPEHVLQHTEGAAFHPALHIPHAELILRKGFRRHIDSYSAFLENDHATPTGLAGYLRERNLQRLFLCGLAYDFCVRYSAIDGKALGFETIVIEDATRPVNLPGSGALPNTVAEANSALATAGIPRIASNTL
jgi:nicotinamidase/pyrazinamidase